MLDNQRITRVLSVYDEINRLIGTEEYTNCSFYYPPNRSDLICDGSVMPLEVLFSDLIFFKATKRELIKSSGRYDEYSVTICFYFGDIRSIEDLRFIDLAIRDSGLHDVAEVEVYTTSSTDELRSEIAAHTRMSKIKPKFKHLSIRSDLPNWLGEE